MYGIPKNSLQISYSLESVTSTDTDHNNPRKMNRVSTRSIDPNVVISGRLQAIEEAIRDIKSNVSELHQCQVGNSLNTTPRHKYDKESLCSRATGCFLKN